MLMLGELLAGGHALRALPPELAEAIAAFPGPPEEFTRQAVLRFERQAPPEAWTTLMSRLASAADPGAACLEHIVRWNLQAAVPGPPGAQP